MSFPIENLPDIPADLIAEVKSLLRVDHDLDDDAIADFVRSAANLCEDFVGQMMISRTVQDVHPARDIWLKMKSLPVASITLVEEIASDGTATTLPVSEYQTDIDSDGLGWVRLNAKRPVSRIRVVYSAGLATDWNDIPVTLRQGIARLAGYLYSNRDGVDINAPPSAVTALWRPHRRMRLA